LYNSYSEAGAPFQLELRSKSGDGVWGVGPQPPVGAKAGMKYGGLGAGSRAESLVGSMGVKSPERSTLCLL